MFFQLPPAGNPITLKKSEKIPTWLEAVIESSKFQLYGSGTSALAAAIKAAIANKGINQAEVLLSAYTCPELVSAILFAGANPVLVDFESKRPWLDLVELDNKLTDKTVAIIAVSLFGIPERFDKLKAIIRDRGVVLIEDSAQYFPASDRDIEWQGDLTVLSFGRGKPISLLGGVQLYVLTAIYTNIFLQLNLKQAKLDLVLICYLKQELLPIMHCYLRDSTGYPSPCRFCTLGKLYIIL